MSAYIDTQTNQYPLFEGDIRLLFPNITFASPFVPPDQYKAVSSTPRPEISYLQNVEEGPPEQANNEWKQTWVISDATPEQVEERTNRRGDEVRLQRDQLLLKSDWTQLDDTPIINAKKLEWASYRQSLRDLPQQQGFPWEVNWPTKPE